MDKLNIFFSLITGFSSKIQVQVQYDWRKTCTGSVYD
jgi:hypothetical protein